MLLKITWVDRISPVGCGPPDPKEDGNQSQGIERKSFGVSTNNYTTVQNSEPQNLYVKKRMRTKYLCE